VNLRDAAVEFHELPTSLIDAPELPARSEMDEEKLEELTADVKAKGVLVPISVVRVGERYEVVAGHRRTIAANRAGLPTIRALVYADKSAALEAIKWSENRFREDMSPAEEATYFSELLERDCGGDTNKLAAQLGEKRSYVEGRLLLFQGAPEVFNALQKKQITIGVAHELNKCTEKLMRDFYLANAIRDGATVTVVTGWIQQWKNTLGPGGAPADATAPRLTAGPVPQTNYFTCAVCGGTDDVHLMQPVNIHTYCSKATLEKALALYNRRGEFLVWPRSIDEATHLVNRLLEAFPTLGDMSSPAQEVP
jgi:ParB/RepB/Spo0J family partition protein